MAKILCNYFGLSMAAEGKSEFVGRQAAAFLGYVQQDAERCAENCGCAENLSDAPEKIKREILRNDEELRRREQTAPGVEHDVVAIYDNAGIPSIMHRFRRVTNKELFGGSDAVHPAFIIGGEVYDEIYISVYENTMINGKPYSLPLQEPVTNITMEDFAQACFSKGEGWHCLTVAAGTMAATPGCSIPTCTTRALMPTAPSGAVPLISRSTETPGTETLNRQAIARRRNEGTMEVLKAILAALVGLLVIFACIAWAIAAVLGPLAIIKLCALCLLG